MEIRVLGPHDADAFHAVRLRALLEHPDAFLMEPEEHVGMERAELLRRLTPSDDGVIAVVGAFDQGALVGMVGSFRTGRPKIAHTAMIWGMYVAPAARGRGAGRAMLDHLIERLRAVPAIERVGLSVMSSNTAARRLYERTGFSTWGIDRGAFQVGGRRLDEHHMVLVLPRGGAAHAGATTGT